MNKYSVGQSVYLLHETNGELTVNEDMFVIQRVSIDDVGFHYSLVSPTDDIIDWCREEDVFINKIDADIELLRRTGV